MENHENILRMNYKLIFERNGFSSSTSSELFIVCQMIRPNAHGMMSYYVQCETPTPFPGSKLTADSLQSLWSLAVLELIL